jgi:hypothetical protein
LELINVIIFRKGVFVDVIKLRIWRGEVILDYLGGACNHMCSFKSEIEKDVI